MYHNWKFGISARIHIIICSDSAVRDCYYKQVRGTPVILILNETMLNDIHLLDLVHLQITSTL